MRLADQSLGAMLLGGWRSSSWCLPSARRGLHRAIMQMDKVTQRNAALVEEGVAAAISLRDQAAALTESVAAFKLRAAWRKAA